MMIQLRKSDERGHTQLGWLDSRHSFSFGSHYDPRYMGFRSLRVINEDHVKGGAGFGEHPHQDMEILSLVLSGSLAHRDSMGNGSVLKAGELQRMTAGSGVFHSEKNPSPDEPVHFLQIWILPEEKGLEPSYEERSIEREEMAGKLALIASRNGDRSPGALKIHQDVDLYATALGANEEARHTLEPGRHAWVQVIDGELTLNGETLHAGDGAAVSDETELALVGVKPSEAILFDLA